MEITAEPAQERVNIFLNASFPDLVSWVAPFSLFLSLFLSLSLSLSPAGPVLSWVGLGSFFQSWSSNIADNFLTFFRCALGLITPSLRLEKRGDSFFTSQKGRQCFHCAVHSLHPRLDAQRQRLYICSLCVLLLSCSALAHRFAFGCGFLALLLSYS